MSRHRKSVARGIAHAFERRYGYTMAKLGALVAFGVVAVAAAATAAHSDTPATGSGCLGTIENPTPCTVTPAEFQQAAKGMTRHDIHRVFGLKGERIGANWFPDGHFRVTVWYPTAGGHVYMRFVDPGAGETPVLDHKLWSAP